MLTTMKARICASSAPSRLACGICTSANSAISPVTAHSTMALIGVWKVSLTWPSWRGTTRSSDQASMYLVACRVDSGVPIRAQRMNPTPMTSSSGTLPVSRLAIRLMPAGTPPGSASLVEPVLDR